MTNTDVLYRIRNLHYVRAGASPFELIITDFTIPQSGITAIIGCSGSGKTTFINLLSGLAQPTISSAAITVQLGGQQHNLGIGNPGFPTQYAGRIFQQGHLLPSATVAVNIAVAAQAAGIAYTRSMLADALMAAGLHSSYLERRAWQLSGGEAQRVSIARAMIANPEVIFADEPTSNVDPDLATQLMQVVRDWTQADNTNPRTMLWVTHDYSLATQFADHIIVLKAAPSSAGGMQAGIIDAETTPRDNPTDPQILYTWVRGATNDVTKPSNTNSAKLNRSATHNLATKLANGELYSRRAGTAYFPHLTAATSIDVAPKVTWAARLWAYLCTFQPHNLLLRVILANILMLVAIGGFMVQDAYFRQQFTNPAFSHITVSGVPHSKYALTPTLLRALNTKPWLAKAKFSANVLNIDPNDRKVMLDELATVASDSYNAGTVSVWPRRTTLGILIGLPDQSGGCEGYAVSWDGLKQTETMILHRKEPVLNAISLIGQRANKPQTAALAFQATRLLTVVVSETFVTQGLNLTVAAITNLNTLCVKIGTQVRLVNFAGVSDAIPADRNHSYDAILPFEAFEALMGPSKSYESASIYFQANELESLKEFLNDNAQAATEEGLNYDADVLRKFTAAVVLSNQLTGVTVFIVILVGLANFFNLYATYDSLVEQNARPIAMQLALGIRKAIIRQFFTRHMLVVWAIGWILTGVAYLIGIRVMLSMGWPISKDFSIILVPIIGTVLVTWLTSVAAIALSITIRVRGMRKNLANALQAGN